MRESKMARLLYFLLFIELILIIPSHQSPRHGFAPEILHADNELPKPNMLEPEMFASFVHSRSKRDVKPNSSEASASQSGTLPSSATSTADKSPKKKPNVSEMTVDGRTNVTIRTTNNITTMVS